MGLKDIHKTFHDQRQASSGGRIGDLSEAYWAYLQRIGEVRDPGRADGYHPSGAFNFCPRAEILRHFFPKPEAGYIPPDLRTTFDWGSAWHAWAQNHHFGPMGVLWGGWRAVCCARVVNDSFLPAPCKCLPVGLRKAWDKRKEEDRAFGGYWEYIEPTLTLPDENIIGHTDGFVSQTPWEADAFDLLEIKTINARGFSRLTSPYDSHYFQAQVYMAVSREMDDLPDPERGQVAYFTKGDKPSPPKIFRVAFDEKPLEEWRRRIALHRRADPEKRLCPGICRSMTDFVAQRCAWVSECFHDDIEVAVEKRRAKA
jgi:hypothetical protein